MRATIHHIYVQWTPKHQFQKHNIYVFNVFNTNDFLSIEIKTYQKIRGNT